MGMHEKKHSSKFGEESKENHFCFREAEALTERKSTLQDFYPTCVGVD